MLVDTFSASALVKIFNAVKDSNKEKLNKKNIKKIPKAIVKQLLKLKLLFDQAIRSSLSV